MAHASLPPWGIDADPRASLATRSGRAAGEMRPRPGSARLGGAGGDPSPWAVDGAAGGAYAESYGARRPSRRLCGPAPAARAPWGVTGDVPASRLLTAPAPPPYAMDDGTQAHPSPAFVDHLERSTAVPLAEAERSGIDAVLERRTDAPQGPGPAYDDHLEHSTAVPLAEAERSGIDAVLERRTDAPQGPGPAYDDHLGANMVPMPGTAANATYSVQGGADVLTLNEEDAAAATDEHHSLMSGDRPAYADHLGGDVVPLPTGAFLDNLRTGGIGSGQWASMGVPRPTTSSSHADYAWPVAHGEAPPPPRPSTARPGSRRGDLPRIDPADMRVAGVASRPATARPQTAASLIYGSNLV